MSTILSKKILLDILEPLPEIDREDYVWGAITSSTDENDVRLRNWNGTFELLGHKKAHPTIPSTETEILGRIRVLEHDIQLIKDALRYLIENSPETSLKDIKSGE